MRLAVVGGGAAGVSVLDSLLRHAEPEARPLELTIYEPAAPVGTGRAYRPDLECALVNREAGYMSIRSADRGHFLRWLHASERYRDTPYATAPVESFVPRAVFGDYLAEHLATCRAMAAARGWAVTVAAEQAVEATTSDDEILLRGAAGIGRFDRVVLCPGTGEPTDPYRLTGAPGFHPDPYPLSEVLPRLPAGGHVLVLGTGLSGIDVALGLLRAGHRGRITMASRHGLLPGVRARPRVLELAHLVPDNIEGRSFRLLDAWRLLRAELTAAGADVAAELRVWPAAEHLRRQLAQVESNPYQTVLTSALHRARSSVWSSLPDRDRHELLARFHPFAKGAYNPMPPPTARTLLAAIEAGQLHVLGGVTDVVPRSGGSFSVSCPQPVPDAGAVVDATRSGLARISTRAAPLLASLVRSGLASPSPFGGLRVDTATNALRTESGEVDPRLYAVGDVTSGELYYAGSMFMINVRSDLVGSMLAARSTVG